MAFLRKLRGKTSADGAVDGPAAGRGGSITEQQARDLEREAGHSLDNSPVRFITPRVVAMGVIVSIGGMIFGYDTGQISGFLEMPDFLTNFADNKGAAVCTTTNGQSNCSFSNGRSGTIVGLLSIGTLIGAIAAAPVADGLGRRIAIIFWNLIFCVGMIVQIATTDKWYQIALGRWVAGLGVGGLSVLTPMYQSETAPKQVRGALVSCYQLFITLGIFVAYCVNYGTEAQPSRRAWRLPLGIGFIWPVIMMSGIMFLRESPRWEYRKGRVDEARRTIALSYGVPENHRVVEREMREIREKFEAETAGGSKQKITEIVKGPRMLYRVLLGMALQALQQLTGANFFFYYGTSIFQATGLSNSYVTSMILGGVNFGCTFGGLYVVEHFGRRKSLIIGGIWMFVCFMVFASVGHFSLDQSTPQSTPQAGTAMIVFACLFIFGYAQTWGPIIWAIVGELYPSRYRALCMGLATSSNWTWNFLISFFTPYITGDIDFRYGYVFAACNLLGAVVVYFFLCESQGRSLEEIDTMYIFRVKPWQSSKWVPPEGEDLVTGDDLARNPRKENPHDPERNQSVYREDVEKEKERGV